ncbi:HBR157Wp [Eremothecium sinecaudum]|uniref:HBR157Wp n=1 Tax=Eremothecium sinecaudum TaxID=45286 RepID=A0A109UX26_9SACH|nr:HBR157Wp [Eremothecium sinecaudum]AMD19058.1 HBR157Wp [Eremothecium sinecaudum]
MSLVTIPVKYLAKHFLKGYRIEMEDPYFEKAEYVKKSFLTGSTKLVSRRVRKPIAEFLPVKDKTILSRVKKQAYWSDMVFNVCGVRFGWNGVIGMIPVIGGFITIFFSLSLLQQACGISGGLPLSLKIQFILNIVFDFLMGMVPIVGDFVSIAYKANSRNILLLEKYLVEKYETRKTN